MCGDLIAGFAIVPDFGNGILEFGQVLEILVHRGEADVGDLVEPLDEAMVLDPRALRSKERVECRVRRA